MSRESHKVVPFPDNDERHVQLGQAALRAGEFSQAVAHFQAAYRDQHTFAVNRQMIEAMLHAGQASEAVPYAEEFIEGYARTLTDGLLYGQLLIESHRFLAAQEWLVNLQDLAHSPEDQARLAELTDVFTNQQERYLAANQAGQAALIKQFAGLAGVNTMEQTMRINQLAQLPVPTFDQIAPRLMIDEFISQGLRNTVALHYVTLREIAPRRLLWFDDVITFTPNAVGNPFDNPVADAWQRAVTAAENDNPEQALILDQELHLYMLLLFPRLTDVVADPTAWAQVVSARIADPAAPITAAPKIKRWLTRLDDALNALNQ